MMIASKGGGFPGCCWYSKALVLHEVNEGPCSRHLFWDYNPCSAQTYSNGHETFLNLLKLERHFFLNICAPCLYFYGYSLSTFYYCLFYTHHSYNLNWLWSSSFVILPNVSSFSFKRLKILAICCCCTL